MDIDTNVKTLLTSASSLEESFYLAKLLIDAGDFLMAIPRFEEIAAISLQQGNIEWYMKSQRELLRIFLERNDSERVNLIKERVQDLILKNNIELDAGICFTLAVCASYRGEHETSLEFSKRSLQLALKCDSKKDICFAINGIAICYKNLGKFTEALKELYNLQVFFQVLDLPEVKVSALTLNAQIYNELGKYDQALELFQEVLETLQKTKVYHTYIRTLYNIGKTYILLGEKETARVYLKLAQRSVDPVSLVVLSAAIQSSLLSLGDEPSDADYDLIIELERKSIVEKKMGRVDFKNQFILMDLLRVLVSNQGQVFSKEDLVRLVWKQEYDPIVHDNKIYVTIKRLRKLIEPDYDKPKYLFRAKNGYFINKVAKVHLDTREESL